MGALWLMDKAKNSTGGTRRVKEKLTREDYDKLLGYDLSKDESLAEKIDIETCTLKSSPAVRIVFQNLFEGTLNSVEMYYVCMGCGHLYWVCLFCLRLFGFFQELSKTLLNKKKEGPHWQKLTTRFSHVLSLDEIENFNKSNNINV